MKIILLAFLLFAIAFAQSPALDQCLKDKCKDNYDKCKATSGCEAKLKKCADKCGEKIAQTCWTLCIGTPGAAANVANCAVKQGCITSVSLVDKVGLTLMQAINNANLQSQ